MRRETYSSLKAVHGAWRVAMGYMYRRPIDVLGQRCPKCGTALDLKGEWAEGRVVCRACGERAEVPGYVVVALERKELWRQMSDEEREVVARWEKWQERRAKAAETNRLVGQLILMFAITVLVLTVAVLVARGATVGR